jgi:hypothetical protein
VQSVTIKIKGRTGEMVKAAVPDWLPPRGWQIDHKGYLQFTSRATRWGIKRGHSAQRSVFHKLVWLTPGERRIGPLFETNEINWHVHHMDNNKLNNCPCNLLFVPHYFNPSPARRCPFTGRHMSAMEWFRLYGPDKGEEVPF